MMTRASCAALILACATTLPVAAQDTTSVNEGAWLLGGSVGVPGYSWETVPELMTVSFHSTRVQRGRPGADFFIGTMPRVLAEGVVAIGARGGLAVPLALSSTVLLLPSAGVSFIGGVGEGDEGGAAGFNAGVAAVVFGEPSAPMGFRAGITWHRFNDFGGMIWLLEIGFVRRR